MTIGKYRVKKREYNKNVHLDKLHNISLRVNQKLFGTIKKIENWSFEIHKRICISEFFSTSLIQEEYLSKNEIRSIMPNLRPTLS